MVFPNVKPSQNATYHFSKDLKNAKKNKKIKFDKSKHKKKPKKSDILENAIQELKQNYDKIDTTKVKEFRDFPFSKNTIEGLSNAKFITPTDIQREAIGLALQGQDILGAAKTGSGKTLAFLIPVLECLYRQKWTQQDGLGALIISPTRELAYQTFEVLRKIGVKHDFSAGLVIGGKHLKEERQRINQTNIVICTPGRLLQHMDETVHFVADQLQILVLDEADRILDLGFQQSMNAIIENLPKQRQTLLFSATQTKSVKDLARLSLQNPMYVSVHENSSHSTPTNLVQSYMVCELHEKFDLLWSFTKNHLKSKVLVFLQSCKQVRFVHECFRRLRPGVTVLALHGGMNQLKRVAVYDQFCRKQHAFLFATDIAARGLDFPEVNWVIQLDCPEDASTYIHRAGRTARYETNGEALLVLTPSEEKGMLEQLKARRIPINFIRINPKKLWSIQPKLESLLASEVAMKEMAQRAFVSYIRSVYLMKNKAVFNVKKLDTEKFSRSLGLAIPPRIRFLAKQNLIQGSKKSKDSSSEEESSSSESEEENTDKSIMKKDRSDSLHFNINDDDELFTVKKNVQIDSESESDNEKDTLQNVSKKSKILTKYAEAKKLFKKNLTVNTKIVYDDDGEVARDPKKTQVTADDEDENEAHQLNIENARERLKKEDEIDKQLFRERIKKKHMEERIKKKEQRREREMKKKLAQQKAAEDDDDDVPVVTLGNPNDGNDDQKNDDVDESEDEVQTSDDASEDDQDSDESGYERPAKRPRHSSEESDDNDDDDDGDDNESYILGDDEEMALKLMNT